MRKSRLPYRLRYYWRRPLRLLKLFLPRSFWGRSLLIVITPVALIQLISGYVFFDRHWEQTTKSIVLGIAGDIAMGTALLNQAVTAQEEERLLALLSTNTEMTIKRSERPDDQYASWPFQSRFERALKRKLQQPYVLHITPRVTYVWIQRGEDFFVFSFSTKRVFSHTTPLWLFWSLGASFFFAFLASFFMRRQIRPLKQLARVAEGLEEGKDISNYRLQGATEIRQIGQIFSLMQRRLFEQLEERAAFLAGISHDLRTPLTRMRLQLTLMPPSPDIEALQKDLSELIHMVEEYLDFIRKEEKTTPQPIPLKPFCQMMLKSFTSPSITVSLDIPDNLEAHLVLTDLKRCLQNLLENAFRYAKSHIWLRASLHVKQLHITIDDDGPGIPPEIRTKVFKPFFRGDSGRNLQAGGTGLGLTIVAKLTEKMNGTVRLETSPAGGLRAVLRLPHLGAEKMAEF